MFVVCGLLVLNDSIAMEQATVLKDETTTAMVSEAVEPTKEATTVLKKSVAKKDDTSKETTTKVATTESANVETTTAKPKPKPSYDVNANVDGKYYSLSEFRNAGVYYDSSGYRYKWYPETVKPGEGLNIPGRYTNEEGYVCDGNGRICIASDDFAYGTVIKIPFGCGIGVVYDNGSGDGTLDIYVH